MTKSNVKAKLERKLCLARDIPEPIFDISDCGLKQIPSGVFSLCKVLRKLYLYLQNNQLTSLDGGGDLHDLFLLRILDLRHNNFCTLTCNIKHLVNLQILHLDNNDLKMLPDEIGCLKCLEELTLSFNGIKILPDSLGNLIKLKRLDLRFNPKISALPLSLCYLVNLEQLLLDTDHEWTVPPLSVIVEGVNEILSYLNDRASGTVPQHIKSSATTDTSQSPYSSQSLHSLSLYDQLMQDRLRRLDKQKKERNQEKIKAQQSILQQSCNELEIQEKNKIDKEKLIKELITQQNQIDEKVLVCQKQREQEKEKFLHHLQRVEQIADQIIHQLLESNKKQNKDLDVRIPQLSEENTLFNNESLKQNMLRSMEELLKEEYFLKAKFQENEELRKNVIQNSCYREAEWKNKVYDLLEKRRQEQTDLLDVITRDTNLQHAAVIALLQEADYRSIALKTNLLIIQHQLSDLTSIELQNKQLNVNEQLNQLAEKRVMLSNLFLDLSGQQELRKQQLISLLLEMKYQEDSRAEVDDRKSVLDAINSYISEKHLADLSPSAPMLADIVAPSAPSQSEIALSDTVQYITLQNECVVCLSMQSDVIFLPCGHLCSCVVCSAQIQLCPMCRSNVEKKARMFCV